jgi:hypothetical protein
MAISPLNARNLTSAIAPSSFPGVRQQAKLPRTELDGSQPCRIRKPFRQGPHDGAPVHAAYKCVQQENREPLRGCGGYFACNFIKIHHTLRVTPAMAAGVTNRLWEVADLVAAWKASEQRLERAA